MNESQRAKFGDGVEYYDAEAPADSVKVPDYGPFIDWDDGLPEDVAYQGLGRTAFYSYHNGGQKDVLPEAVARQNQLPHIGAAVGNNYTP